MTLDSFDNLNLICHCMPPPHHPAVVLALYSKKSEGNQYLKILFPAFCCGCPMKKKKKKYLEDFCFWSVKSPMEKRVKVLINPYTEWVRSKTGAAKKTYALLLTHPIFFFTYWSYRDDRASVFKLFLSTQTFDLFFGHQNVTKECQQGRGQKTAQEKKGE